MGTAAAVAGDPIVGVCPNHLMPDPLGLPVPAGPRPFSAPVLVGTAATVVVQGRPVVLAASSGLNTPPHVGLHPADPFAVPAAQIGRVLVGSLTVLAEGRPVARLGSAVTCCVTPGLLRASAVTVQVA